MPMLYFGPQKKWAAVNFPVCPSIRAHFRGLSQGLLTSSLRWGGWGSFWQCLLPTLQCPSYHPADLGSAWLKCVKSPKQVC